jgi:serine/threonine-protein kinase
MSETLPEGAVVAGRLRIVRVLGTGGMGAVYEVEHLITKHRRALKLLHPQVASTPGVIERFLREASAAGRVGSPHIVETFDAGTTERGEPYIVMELLRGRSLADLLAARGALEVGEATEILSQASEGVQAAHEAGIVHRDLKPENLFVVEGGKPFVKIVDFGISKFDPAKTEMSSATADGTVMGTPYYMSPEQVRGAKHVDQASDIYALGVVLYECLVGRRPFEATTLPQLAILIHEGRYEPASSLRPGLPPALDAVIGRALSPRPDGRFSSARSLGDALRRASEGTAATVFNPESAPPPRDAPALDLGTAPALSHTNPSAGTLAAAPARSRALWVGAFAAAVVVGLGLALGLGGSASETPTEERAPSAEPAARTAAKPAPPKAEPHVEPAPAPEPLAAPAPAPSGPSPFASVSASPAPASAAASTRPAPAKSSPSTTRARERGLAEENPFR